MLAKEGEYVPPTPQIRNLTADFPARTLTLEWDDGGSTVSYDTDVTWEIQILRKDPMETVALETYHSKLTSQKDTTLYWSWTSDLPFECTTHYVQIRCNHQVQYFRQTTLWSEWSELANISGLDTGKIEKVRMFPFDEVVEVGSDLKFCCVWGNDQRLRSIQFDMYPPEQSLPIRLSNWSSMIYVPNVNKSIPAGSNAWCIVTKPYDLNGATIFIGYPPDIPQNLTCETSDLKEITCGWGEGRNTGLYSPWRRTNWTLFESISGENVTYNKNDYPQYYRCNFPVLDGQRMYNFTVHGVNPLGQSESSILIDINYRVLPSAPTALTVTDNNATHVTLSWRLSGNLTPIMLQCMIRIKNRETTEFLKVQLDGTESSDYSTSVEKLHPYTKYAFRVRCSAAEPFFWKWSKWSESRQHTTLEALPARGPDVWRERSLDGKAVNIFWKPLPVSETNGLILMYEVHWSEPEKGLRSQEVPAHHNSTTINLEGNDYDFQVTAKNKAGSSPPSTIKSAEVLNENPMTEEGFATGDGVSFDWGPDSEVTCGYTVRWCYPSGPEPCVVDWEMFSSDVTHAVIKSAHFQPGVRYQFSVLGCKDNGYQLKKYINGYTKELSPRIAPNVEVEYTTSDSIVITWEALPVNESGGFLKGYLLEFAKGEEDRIKSRSFETEMFNITEPKQTKLRISKLQGKTSYHLNLSAYTAGGIGPGRSLYVITKENSVGLIIAIIIPVAIVVVLALVTSILCYRKREWIKETFYPDIPNPVNSKALEFQKGPCEGKANPKTLEMNPCTPNNIEVVETLSPCLKVEDTAITSPVADELPEDGFDSESESHIVVSYCPPIIEEEISNPPGDESMGSSQVVYINFQSMYPPQVRVEEEPGADCVATAGYKPQLQLPINSLIKMEDTSSAEEYMDKGAGYRPQVNPPTWNTGCPDSPGSTESNNENASFGSPCSINSRQFLIPPKEDEDSPKVITTGWNFTNFFHNKPND
ncbi:leukemia inhibitory factor receptor [Heteronotia binoei]|uniref:leukemia inhibitory factor receptor n=1 Tax=Heteronotia binoei TaxID=13085 RepID=UPI00292EFB84|nr:leukemia inhibitory factor receptor [Heteronotia binoei]